jgi:hypothetical protein
MNEPSARVLSGYKEIAAFLGVSAKTIQRHRKTIPISRLGKIVMVTTIDLVVWVQKNSKKNKNGKRLFRSST